MQRVFFLSRVGSADGPKSIEYRLAHSQYSILFHAWIVNWMKECIRKGDDDGSKLWSDFVDIKIEMLM